MPEYSPNELVAMFEEFLTPHQSEIQQAADWSEAPSFAVSFAELNRFNVDFAMHMLKHPKIAINAAEEAALRLVIPTDDSPRIRIQVTDMPQDAEVPVHSIRARIVGRLIGTRGIISLLSEVKPRLVDAVFQCLRCNCMVKEPQEQEEETLREPLQCYKDQGGCERTVAGTKFRLVIEASAYVDTQLLEIQEAPETTSGRMPEKIRVLVEGEDLVGQVRAGDRVVCAGILKTTTPQIGRRKLQINELYLDALGIEILESPPDEIDITPADVKRIEELAKNPDVFNVLRDSFAPTVIETEMEKLAIVLQMFGGVAKELPDGTRIRGDIHNLLIGDPGTAKSKLLRAAATVAPRGRLVTADNASAPGLTAAMEQVKAFGATRWVARPGVLPLSDRGFLSVDEFDKMPEGDHNHILDALDPQIFTVAKAATFLTLVSRTPVLAAANPKFGRWAGEKLVTEQITLDPVILSRFDAIFVVQDVPEKARDARLSESMLRVHQAATDPQSAALEPLVESELMKKYIAYAKRLSPRLLDDALATIKAYYLELRGSGWASGVVSITPRQLDSLVRYAEASARVRLSNTVDVQDAEQAIFIYKHWTAQVLGGEMGTTGPIDIDIIASGIPKSQRDQVILLRDTISDLGGTEGGEGANEEDILELAERRGIPRERTKLWLQKWHQEGDIYSAFQGRYKLVTRI